MATIVQSKSGVGTTSPLTVSFTNTPALGNLLIAAGIVNPSGTTTVTSGGNTWSLAVSAIVQAGAVGIYWRVAGAAEAKDVTVTQSTATTLQMNIFEYDLVNATLDQVGKEDDSGTGTTTKTSGTTPSTISNIELIFAVIGIAGTTSSPSWSNSFTEETASTLCKPADLSVTTMGAYETTRSWTTTRRAGGIIATFRSQSQQINIGDVWKYGKNLKINIGDVWKTVKSIQQNIGDVWKKVF